VVDAGGDLAGALADAAARLGASIAECRGGRAALEAVGALGADAAIVDLPLPDVRGDAFLVALRERGIPCVAVSAVLKGDRYAEIARRFGAAGFFERPFEPAEAFAALAQAMPEPPPLPWETPTATPTPAPAPVHPERSAAGSKGDPEFESLIFSAARPALDDVLPTPPFASRPANSLSLPVAVADLPSARGGAAPSSPAGDLATTPLPRLLAALHAGRTSGALTLVRGSVKKLVGLERGTPVFAISNVPAERFGAVAVRAGVLSAEALRALTAELGATGRVADALVARGLLDPAHRVALVGEQIREVIWSAFAWADGTYRLVEGPFERKELVRVELAPGDLVLEGRRRTAVLDALRTALPATRALGRGPAPAVRLEELALSRAEAQLVAHADGTKTIADLVALGGLPEREALALLQGCRDVGILIEVERGLSGTRRIGFM
jgi:two-component system, OmpR family, response regulator